jgi:hypothetical protein
MKYLKTILPYIAIAVLAFLLFRSCDQAAEVRDSLSSIIESREGEVRYLKTELGKTISEKQAAEVSAHQFKEHYKKDLKRLEDEFNIKLKRIKVFATAPIQVDGEGMSFISEDPIDFTGNGKFHLRNLDSLRLSNGSSSHLMFSDKYLSFDVDMSEGREGGYKSTYTYRDTISYVLHVKKRWIFGKERLYGSWMFENPNAVALNPESVVIEEYKDKRFAVTIGPYFDPFRGNYGVSIGLGWTLIKF